MGNELEKGARSNCGLCFRDTEEERMPKNKAHRPIKWIDDAN